MPIVTILTALLLQSARVPSVGLHLQSGAFVVDTGGTRRPATAAERRQIEAEEPLPVHPSGRYSIVPSTVEDPNHGTLKGVKILDKAGRSVATAAWLFGNAWDIANNTVSVVGWGIGPDDVVVCRRGGSPSAGMSATYVSLNLKTRKQNPSVLLLMGQGLALRIGTSRTATEQMSQESSSFPPLFRVANGRSKALALHRGAVNGSVAQSDARTGYVLLRRTWSDWPILDLRNGTVRNVTANGACLLK